MRLGWLPWQLRLVSSIYIPTAVARPCPCPYPLLPLAVIIAGVAAIVLVIKWRQRRRTRQSVYNRAADELTAGVREQQYAWKGPYVSRTSFNRSPSPVSRSPSPSFSLFGSFWNVLTPGS